MANHPTRRGKDKSPSDKVNKTKFNITTEANLTGSRIKLGAQSLPSLSSVQGVIYEEARRELRFPQSTKIYKQMTLEANIASALALIEAMISQSEWKITVPDLAPQADKDIAEKLNYNLLVMERPFNEYIGEILSYLVYGFHTSEKIYEKMETPVGNFVGWKDFITVSQDTVDKWIIDDNGSLVGLRQAFNRIVNDITKNKPAYVDLPRKKFFLVRYNTKRNNPEGESPLKSCYVDWKYSALIQEFETIFTTKGLGGILDLGIDVAFLAKAAADPKSDEALVVKELKASAANFHNGDQAYTITPLAYTDKGNPLFHTKILETKPPATDEIIKRYSHRMLQTFFADILMLGSTGSGSYALSDNKTPILQAGIRHHLTNIKRTLNHDLIPQIYKLNGWTYDARYACRFECEDIDDGDLDVLSKVVQRIFSVEALDRTEDVEDWIRGTFMDLKPRSEANTNKRETPEMQSRSGEGKGTSGTGGSDQNRDSSTSNSENA